MRRLSSTSLRLWQFSLVDLSFVVLRTIRPGDGLYFRKKTSWIQSNCKKIRKMNIFKQSDMNILLNRLSTWVSWQISSYFITIITSFENKGWSISLGPSQKNCSFSLTTNPKTLKLWHLILDDLTNITLNFHISIPNNKGDIKVNILEIFFSHVLKLKNRKNLRGNMETKKVQRLVLKLVYIKKYVGQNYIGLLVRCL
jgi:hypothetical protein